jgi:large conductance mechanosensitive channel
MGLFSDFKAFAIKGNMLDLAIGVVIGGAFGKIITSLVTDIIMPPFGYLLNGIDFKTYKYVLSPEVKDAAGAVTKPAVVITYGNFLQVAIEFFIIAFSIFLFVRLIERMKKAAAKEEAAAEAAAPAPEPSADVLLLTEIRDLLKDGRK